MSNHSEAYEALKRLVEHVSVSDAYSPTHDFNTIDSMIGELVSRRECDPALKICTHFSAARGLQTVYVAAETLISAPWFPKHIVP